MGEGQRVSRSKANSEPSAANGGAERAGATSARSPAPSADWVAAHLGSAFPLGGVQRKVQIGPAGDAYEREADRISADVASGRSIVPSAISPIGSLSSPVGQRAAAPDDKKKDEKPKTPAVQKAAAPEDKKKDEKPKAPAVQKAAAPDDKKKDEKPKAPAVQKAAAPEDKKKDEKPKAPAVQKAAAPDDKKKDEKPKAPAVQKAAAPEDKKKDEKPKAPAVQKAAAPDDKKKDEKPKAPAVQKAAAPEDKKKDEKPKAPAVQKAAAPEDKKKDEKPKAPAVQKAAAPDDKKKDEKPKAPAVQKAAAPDDKKKDEKPKAPAVQKAAAPEDKKKDEKPKAPAVQKAAAPEDKKKDEKAKPAAVQRATPKEASTTPKEKKKDEDKGVDEKLKDAPVQMAAAPEDKKRDEEPPSPAIETANTPEDKKDEKPSPVQRGINGGGAAPTPSMESAASQAIQSKGSGEPLNAGTRSTLEPRMGVDLGDVRVHQDRAAHETADAINARAFTHGHDIWLGRHQSQADTSLMAHEATHVVQQTGSVHRQLVQRAPKPPASGTPDPAAADPAELDGQTVVIPKLRLPDYDRKWNSISFPYDLPKEKPVRPTDQRSVWEKDIAGDGVFKSSVKEKLKTAPKIKSEKTQKDVYFLKPNVYEKYIIGDEETLPDKLGLPNWDKDGKYHQFDVEHIKEIQLGGDNLPTNMELLDSSANRSSGSSIAADIDKKTRTAATQLNKEGKIPSSIKDLATLRAGGYTVKFKDKEPYKVAGDPTVFWSRKDTVAGEHLKPVRALTAPEVEKAGLRGDPTRLVFFTKRGGKPLEVKGWDKGNTSYPIKDFLPKFDLETVTYTPGAGGQMTGTLLPRRVPLAPKSVTWGIAEMPGVEYGGQINFSLTPLTLNGASFIEIADADLDSTKGVIVKGILKPSIPPIKDLEIDLLIEGGDITLSKTFSAGELAFPGPIKVTDSSLTLAVGTAGVEVTGDVHFEIDRVGKGGISGKASSKEGFSIAGEFEFDTQLFDPAKINVEYKAGKFSGGGTIGIKAGKVRGIKSATIQAKFTEDVIDATGTIIPDIPAVEQADLKLHYDATTGLTIAGDLQLKKDIPGIAGGSIHAEVTRKDERYTVKASGEATPKIPGVSSKLIVTYDDGAFDAVVTAGYEKGMLSGSITVGATNRPVGDDGKPAGPPPEKGDKITLYGGGSVTLKLAPWLQATAAIKLLPNGEIEVTGKIGLPAVIDIFPEKKLDKNIFKIGIDIPIVGVAAAGQRIGIFANISGGLDLSAGIGPGQLQQLELSVTYNPAHEDQTKVVGDAKLHIPAMAGLRLFVRGSLGVGIPLVSASAGLEIGGMLGLEGALDAGVHVEWTPTKGLDLQAEASIFVEPVFKFDITGFVLVELGLVFTTIELYSKKWQLASFEYGSGLRLGMKFPIHYQEGKPFDISLSDVQFEYPKIDPGELLSGLIKKIA